MVEAARASGHIWPEYAACEAALDSNFGTTELAIKANNVFNLRAPAKWPIGSHVYVQTVNGKQYDWLEFRTVESCFAARMDKLRRFTMFYLALRAKTAAEYVTQVSKLWSGDPMRAKNVLSLYAALEGK